MRRAGAPTAAPAARSTWRWADDFRDIAPGQPVTEALRALARQTATDGSGTPAADARRRDLTALRAVDCGT